MQCMVVLEESNEQTGCTLVVPGSHRSGEYCEQSALDRAVPIEAKPGDVIELIATDPTSEKDVEKFCEYLNHELISKEIKKELLKFKVKKNRKS